MVANPSDWSTTFRAFRAAPSSLLEFTVKRSVGAILGKKQWWRKWQERAIRMRWLDELQHEFLHQSFTQTLQLTRRFSTLRQLETIASQPYSQEKQALADDWCRFVRYQKHFQLGTTPEDSDKDLLRVNAYAIARWFFTYAVLCETLQSIPKKLDPRVIPRAVDFVRAVLEKGVTREAVEETLASIEARPYTLALLYDACNDIQKELLEIQEVITRTIDRLASSDDLRAQFASAENGVDTAVLSPTGIPGAWIADELIPVAVKSTFLKQVAVLENVPGNLKDWHPNTNKQVLNLIHPSLYCVFVNRTRWISEPLILGPSETPADHMKQLMFAANTEIMNHKSPLGYASPFQWIPSDFEIRDDGSVRIASYINNLHPEQHVDMCTSIEAIFSRFVPLFERALGSLKIPFPTGEFIIPDDHLLGKQRPIIWDSLGLPHAPQVSLRGKTVQVVVKMAEILLTPESSRYNGGSWHIEGTPTERIVATGIYYFGNDNITSSQLSFRVNVNQPPYDQGDAEGVVLTYGFREQSLLVQQLGSVVATVDRCIVFPNLLQYKVEPFELADPTKPGYRKILAFFLVDPENEIPSTSVIPPQQHDWIVGVQEYAAAKLRWNRGTQRTIHAFSRGATITLEKAQQCRIHLMEERSGPSKPDPKDYESYFNLCEH